MLYPITNPIKPNQIQLQNLANVIRMGNTILVIGHELMHWKIAVGSEEISFSLMELIGYEYLRKYVDPIALTNMGFNPSDFPSDLEFNDLIDIPVMKIKTIFTSKFGHSASGIEIIHAIYHLIIRSNPFLGLGFKAAVSKIVNQYSYTNLFPQIPEPLRLLSSIKDFKFFVNATFTHSLQIALENTRIKDKDNLEVYGYYPFNSEGYNNFKIKEPRNFKSVRETIDKTTIYNLFGIHDLNSNHFVITEADYIELLHDLSINEKDKYKSLKYLLSKANLLFIGCNFKDWFLRFFLRICSSDKNEYESSRDKSFIIDNLAKADNNLVVFMNNYSIQTADMPVLDFIRALHSKFNQNEVEENVHKNFIFISFCSADREYVKKVKEQLGKSFIDYKIWYDEDYLKLGHTLDSVIGESIKNCAFFVPFVSSNIQKSEVGNSYFWKEWDLAVKLEKVIVPIWIGKIDEDMILINTKVNVEEGIRNKIIKKNKFGIILPGDDGLSDDPIPKDKIQELKKRQFNIRLEQLKR